jgi:hypothetical protein
MIVRYSPTPYYDCMVQTCTILYIDRTQLVIRHLHELIIVWCKCCTVLKSDDAGAISKLKPRERHLQEKVMTSIQFQCHCCLDVETVFWFCCDGVSLKLENKAKQWNSLSVELFESTFDTCYILPDSPFKGTVAWDFLASVFSWICYIWASDFEAKRIFFSFSFSQSYSNISINPRCRLRTAGIQTYFFEDSKTNGKIW